MGIEPEAQEFLRRIMLSLGAGLAWLLFNMTAGIFAGWLFFRDTPTKGNYIFYAWLVISLGFLLRFYIRLWRRRIPFE